MRTIHVPPSKSMAHRAIICAGLAEGKSCLFPIDLSQDIEATCRCMKALGVEVRSVGGTEKMEINGGLEAALLQAPGNGPGTNSLQREESPLLDCGESGSTLRFLLPIALLSRRKVRFTGSERLMERPLEPYFQALRQGGGQIEKIREPVDEEKAERTLLEVQGPLAPGRYRLPGDVSSQYVSGLLFALPLLAGDSEILLAGPLESEAYVELTLEAMRSFGVKVEKQSPDRYLIPGGQHYRPCEYEIEADFSNAAFFLTAGALGQEYECLGLDPDSRQGDKEILSILKEAGADITYHEREEGGEKKRTAIAVRPGKLKALTVDARQIPDLVPILAVLLAFCKGESRIINAGRLRLKESDRLQTISQELGKLGAKIEEGPDSLTIQGVDSLRSGRCSSHNDHRIAMALAVASCKSKGIVEIEGSDCVKKSYPSFWEDLGEGEKVRRL